MKNWQRKIMIPLFIAGICTLVAACGKDAQSLPEQGVIETTKQTSLAETNEGAESGKTEQESEGLDEGSKILIAYFSVPEDVNTDGIDANSSASIVVKDGNVMGANEYIASLIQQNVGGDVFRIETVQQYPLNHEPLVDQAADEQDANARPELAVHVENMDSYDVIFIGFPNWWGDMPMPLYTFLEEYDLSGKTIIPFVSHGGSRFSRTIQAIQEAEPNAMVVEEGLCLDRDDVFDSEETIKEWTDALVK